MTVMLPGRAASVLRDGKVGAANTLAASAGTNNTEESILDVVEEVRGI